MQAVNSPTQQGADLLVHKKTHFVLWRPVVTETAPRLIIGTFTPSDPPTLAHTNAFSLLPSAKRPDLWEIAARECLLEDGKIYHYWFEVTDSNLYKESHPRIWCTDPFALNVDWRLLSPVPDDPAFGNEDRYPAGIVRYQDGELQPCDPEGQQPDWRNDPPLETLPVNTQLVIYELPTAWARTRKEGGVQVAGGTFRDVLALVDPGAIPFSFFGIAVLQEGRAHLRDLGINALELLPPADSYVDGGWGYATTNYFTPDHDLGWYGRNRKPAPATELARLIRACHQNGVRFFADVVMAFSARNPYRAINFPDFFVKANGGDPEEYSEGVRRDDPWRARIVDQVARLVKLRTSHEALWVNETTFIHSDFCAGKRVMAWVRGNPGSDKMVVIVANFSDYSTPNAHDKRSEYVVSNWPQLPEGMRWHEVTQDRKVPLAWAGREPIFAWEAKVYVAV